MQCIQGTVIHGKGEGRLLGYPTANLDTTTIELEVGIYAGFSQFHGASLKLPTAIIVRPLEHAVRIEAHILDWSEQLYGKAISVCPLEKIRDWLDIADEEKLKIQIEQDIERIRTILATALLNPQSL